MNLRIKMGAMSMATGIVGTSLLILENMKTPKPRTNQTTDR
jgi:hypothetical protein